jgi:hypothetical protein
MVRNAKDDLALCDKATPGPWKYDGMHNEIQTPRGETYWLIVSECRSAPDQEHPDDPQYDANFDFIAMAREALPFWIARAEKMEKALERACKHIFFCPPEGVCAAGLGVKCADCLKKYFLEEEADKNDDD